jgi:RimJ/RimL family protein N-acetyltransferase
MLPAPVLHSARLTLRMIEPEDHDAYCQLRSTEEIERFIGGKPLTPEQCWERLLRAAGHWHHLDFGYWVVIETQSGRLIGECGFLDMHRDLEPSLTGTIEAGWLISPSEQGKGYALEAMQTALSWAYEHFPGRTTSCIISPDNRASINLALKLGFRQSAETTYHGSPILIFKRGA